MKIKSFLATPSVLYISASDNTLISVLVQDIEGNEKPVYFASKIFKGAELMYQKIKKVGVNCSCNCNKVETLFTKS